jgi:arsenate reductase
LLKEHNVDYTYREYTENPLSESEIREIVDLLGLAPKALLRRNDKAYKELALSGEEEADTLIAHMAKHPTLLQRPIGILNGKAVVGRPHERLLELL